MRKSLALRYLSSNLRRWRPALAVLSGLALAAGAAWAAPTGEDDSAAAMDTMEREMVTDPTTGMEVPAPQYGGTLTAANDREIANTDQSIGGLSAGFANSGVVEKLGIGNWGHRSQRQRAGHRVSRHQPLRRRAGAELGGAEPQHVHLHRPRERPLA